MSEKVREEFESWCHSIGFTLKMNAWGNDYAIGYGWEQWQAWQASRSALVVELPSDISGEHYADGWNAALMCVEGVLEEAGVSYK